jgi:hypothetical protein
VLNVYLVLVFRYDLLFLPNGLHALLLDLFGVAWSVVVGLEDAGAVVPAPAEEAVVLAQRRLEAVHNHLMVFRALENGTEARNK